MRPEKQNLTKEYLVRLNGSPFFIVVNYKGLKVAHMTQLRSRLTKAGAEIHIVKNSIFRIAAKEAGVGELNGGLSGQLAVVTGQRDISAAAKVVKTFGTELDRREHERNRPEQRDGDDDLEALTLGTDAPDRVADEAEPADRHQQNADRERRRGEERIAGRESEQAGHL